MPWRERCQYVFAAGSDGAVNGSAAKRMHVSPFLGMDYTHHLRTAEPGERLAVSVVNTRDGRSEFAAGLNLELAGDSAVVLRRTVARFPAMAALVTARIFWQALRMRLAGYRWHSRPAAGSGVETEHETKDADRHVALS
jgi:hypothetical protein